MGTARRQRGVRVGPRGRVGLLLVAAMAVAGCSADADRGDLSGPYADDFTFALENATSNFERRVLADGVITADEYDEAHHLWLECMQDSFPPGSDFAVGIRKREDGLYEFMLSSPPGLDASDRQDEFDQLDAVCSTGTVEHVAPLYNDIADNPERASYEQLVFTCLADRGEIADGYTVEDFTVDLEALYDGRTQSDQSPLQGWPDSPESQGCL